jgi:hypothetical protein
MERRVYKEEKLGALLDHCVYRRGTSKAGYKGKEHGT